jgi:galactonate dehydratase
MRIQSVEAMPVRLARAGEPERGTAGSPTFLAAAPSDYRWSAAFPALYSIHFETALVKVTTDTGLTGWGEAQAPLAPEVACTIIDLLLRPVLLGREFGGDTKEIGRIWELMYSTMRVRGQTGGFMLDAISGIDLALWDLAGKIQGRSVCDLIAGGKAKKLVPAYLSGVAGASIEDRVATARQWWKKGFRHFKLFHNAGERELLETMDALRSALPADVKVAVDALWRLRADTAFALGRELDDRAALWLEAPLPPEDWLAHRELAARISTPLAIGESYRTVHEILPFLREAARVVQPDLGRSGITEGLRIAELAARYSASVVPHVSIALGPQIAAAIHYAAACDNCDLAEYNPHVLDIANRFLAEPLSLDGAAYQVPTAPGVGVEILEEKLRAELLPSGGGLTRE